MNTNVKVVFLTRKLQPYRIPILRRIVEMSNIHLTVGHSGKALLAEDEQIEELIFTEKQIGPFAYHTDNLVRFCNGYDVVVAMMYLQQLSFMKLLFSPYRAFKIAYWGIGVKASISTKFDSPSVFNYVRYAIAYFANASIFYTDYAKRKYEEIGVISDKLFVMQNTVEVLPPSGEESSKDRLLFVGALYPQKRIDVLLDAYLLAFEKEEAVPDLHIIGRGSESSKIEEWIKENNVENKVILQGAIFDEEKLRYHFEKSIACISPGQAGLSVLKSMGYGVPFVTIADAATGGERLNIENGYNGVLYESYDCLESVILSTASDRDRWLKMGVNAYNYYWENRTPEIMAKGFVDAVMYMYSK